MGSFLFQFKKYFFQYMKNLVASPYVDRTVGRYIIDKDITRPDGVPVYKWESEVMEGRLKVLASALSAGLSSKKNWQDYWQMKDFDGTSLKASRRKHMMELLNTLLWMAGLFVFYITMFPDDDDKKTPLARYVQRIGYDASMGLNPKDLFESMKKPVVALDRIPTVGTAL